MCLHSSSCFCHWGLWWYECKNPTRQVWLQWFSVILFQSWSDNNLWDLTFVLLWPQSHWTKIKSSLFSLQRISYSEYTLMWKWKYPIFFPILAFLREVFLRSMNSGVWAVWAVRSSWVCVTTKTRRKHISSHLREAIVAVHQPEKGSSGFHFDFQGEVPTDAEETEAPSAFL